MDKGLVRGYRLWSQTLACSSTKKVSGSEAFEGSSVAEQYMKFRQKVPDHVTKSILDNSQISYKNESGKPALVVDVGCGSGQFTQSLARYCDRVMGFDLSKGQIAEANRLIQMPNLEFSVAPSDDLPLQDKSVDLMTVASAAHWFPLATFSAEAERVLRPGGVIAILTPLRRRIYHDEPMIQMDLHHCVAECLKKMEQFAPIGHNDKEKFYCDLEFPFAPQDEMIRYGIDYAVKHTPHTFTELVKTMSYAVKYQQNHPDTSLFVDTEKRLHEIVQRSSSQEFKLITGYEIMIARKPDK
ncbi:uncharacterized methyltransferase Mb3374-like [Diadema antillarum]|uniref:uncharacterized methyltransferase Mb3374-like n=1 Tax=Diadema antillarum TaxID=105358 RepID=UPI003A847BF4